MLWCPHTDIFNFFQTRQKKNHYITFTARTCFKWTTTKNRASYQSLFQNMATAVPELRNDHKAYGSDGEEALIQALGYEFPFALGFLCRTHVLRNIERVKTELHLSEFFYRTVREDTFRKNDVERLVNCNDRTEYDLLVAKLQAKWDR